MLSRQRLAKHAYLIEIQEFPKRKKLLQEEESQICSWHEPAIRTHLLDSEDKDVESYFWTLQFTYLD